MWYLIFITEDVTKLQPDSLPIGWIALSGSMLNKIACVREELPGFVKPWHRVTLVELPADDRRRLDKFVEQGLTPGEAFKSLLLKRGPQELILLRNRDTTPKEWMMFEAR
jgi:hypothetical protein